MITISFNPINKVKYIIFKEDNITIYFKDFDVLLQIMDFSDEIHRNKTIPFTYTVTHDSDSTNKSRYHDGIDAAYTDEGHYHFEREDANPLTREDNRLFIQLLKENDMINQEEAFLALNTIDNKVNTALIHECHRLPFYVSNCEHCFFAGTEPEKAKKYDLVMKNY